MAKIVESKKHKGLYEFMCPACGYIHQIATSENDIGWPAWIFNGNLESPTVSPSILVTGEEKGKPTRCHSFVRDGKIQFLSDCTHLLAGKTVEIPDFDRYYS